MKKALILQGWYQRPDSNWYQWLKDSLEDSGYEVYLPDLPTIHTRRPDWAQIESAVRAVVEINKDLTIIGHSLGCLMALRLAEKDVYGKMILVSGWDFNDLTREHETFWSKPLNHKIIRKNVKDIVCFGSDNDPYFTFFTVDEMSKRLGGKSVLVKGAGHFTDKFSVTEVPQVLKFV